MSNIKLACFDVDGVILDSYSGSIMAINQTIKEFGGQEISEEEFRNQSLGSMEAFMYTRGIPINTDWQKMSDSLDKYFSNSSLYQEITGIRAVFSYLQTKKIPIYLISAVNRQLTEDKIKYHEGLIDFVSGVLGGEKKGELISDLCKSLNILPAETIFVSDMERDFNQVQSLELAHNIALASKFSTIERLRSVADYLVLDHSELLVLLKNLLG